MRQGQNGIMPRNISIIKSVQKIRSQRKFIGNSKTKGGSDRQTDTKGHTERGIGKLEEREKRQGE